MGLEMICWRLEAEEDLRSLSNGSTVFAGGDAAKRYVQSLHDRIEAIEMIRKPAVVKRRKMERARAEMVRGQALMARVAAASRFRAQQAP